MKTAAEIADEVIAACDLEDIVARIPAHRNTIIGALEEHAKAQRIKVEMAMMEVYMTLPRESDGRRALEAVMDRLGVPP